jgi:hypothetical protein
MARVAIIDYGLAIFGQLKRLSPRRARRNCHSNKEELRKASVWFFLELALSLHA